MSLLGDWTVQSAETLPAVLTAASGVSSALASHPSQSPAGWGECRTLPPGDEVEQGLGPDALDLQSGYMLAPDTGHISVSELSPCRVRDVKTACR